MTPHEFSAMPSSRDMSLVSFFLRAFFLFPTLPTAVKSVYYVSVSFRMTLLTQEVLSNMSADLGMVGDNK